MSKVFIVGGSGQIARHLAKQLNQQGHTSLSLYRQAGQAEELKALGSTPVHGDLLTLEVGQLAELMTGCDVVVFSAGAGGKGGSEMTNAIDGRGLELSVAAAQQAGIKRFILVSAFPEAGRGTATSEQFENYMQVKKLSDAHLSTSNLSWVILRPGTLINSPGTGTVRAGLAIPYDTVAREDVASALLAIIEKPSINRVIIELTQGDTPVADAIQQFA